MAVEIVEADAIEWCADNPEAGAVVTGIPDAEEVITDEYADPWDFFRDAVDAALMATADDAPAIFTQTDRRSDGTVSKARIVMNRAESVGYRLLWHKIALNQDPGTTNLYRPTYTHVLGFGREDVVEPGSRTPDVWYAGDRIYENATDLRSAEFAINFASSYSRTIVDPFCGRGTVPVLADALGYDGIGIDVDPEQVEAARDLEIRPR